MYQPSVKSISLQRVGGILVHISLKNKIILPQWLDNLIYRQLGANYCCSKSNMTVIDWDRSETLNYLGTYFPRSFCEAYCIFDDYFQRKMSYWRNIEDISIFDFGCGTGGEIVGLIYALSHNCKKLKKVTVKAMDGNNFALRLLEGIVKQLNTRMSFRIILNISALKIDDVYDISIINSVINEQYDIIMSFKTIGEFVTKKQFEDRNPYQFLPSLFKSKLTNSGFMLLEDVTSYSDVSREWLTKMMDEGLSMTDCTVIHKNGGYNQSFWVSHSQKKDDKSKVAWRILK